MKKIKMQQGTKQNLEVFPADRALKQAAAYPAIYLNQQESKKTGTKFLQVSITHKKASVALVPFYKKEHKFYDSLLFWEYPSGALI